MPVALSSVDHVYTFLNNVSLPSPPTMITPLSGGTTNKLFKILLEDGTSLSCRFFGNRTCIVIDRDQELFLRHHLIQFSLAPRVLFSNKAGDVAEYIEGRSLEDDEMARFAPSVIESLCKLHSCPVPTQATNKSIFDTTRSWISQLESGNSLISLDLNRISVLLKYFEHRISQLPKLNPCICHNDLHAGNLILTPENQISFIDCEYCSLNNPAYDLANFFVEHTTSEMIYKLFPSRKRRLELLSQYQNLMNHSISLCEFCDLVDNFVSISLLHWAVWAELMAQCVDAEFDYHLYVKKRIQLLDDWLRGNYLSL
ncbi:hypothetical protein P9112_006993 [Eukaryota sp. TZLM1-RC]